MKDEYGFDYAELFAKIRLAKRAMFEFREIYNHAIQFTSKKTMLKSEIAFDVLANVLDEVYGEIDKSLWDDVKRDVDKRCDRVLEEDGYALGDDPWDI